MRTVYVALSKFCEQDDGPRRVLTEAGLDVLENKTGRRLREEEMYALLKDVDGVLAAVEPYRAGLLEKLPRLKCISRCGVGTDNIDLEAAEKYGKAVFNTPDEIVEPVAQMTVAMILNLARRLNRYASDFWKGEWVKRSGFLLSEWTAGIIGFGRVGKRVAHYLKPFGTRILVYDPAVSPAQFPEFLFCRSLDELLSQSDIVTLHAGRPTREGVLMNLESFRKMKPGSYFVNTSRGYLVDETALHEMLVCGHLAGAALDVFAQEPYQGSLNSLLQVIGTPHAATLTRASRSAMELKAAQNLACFFSTCTKTTGSI
ncbi:MAG: phosphoglycerate dehydrogenase [Deltaproteobacteria bacterium]|nr:phosphoglycerate dehydrogenase [Deltaproteobacteria bacterium]MBI4223737.1 phosphoglycerate dehydrogenase [Deltaproteobacteria bacterium]